MMKESQILTLFNFDSIFIDKNFEEIHNNHSIVIHGDSLEILKKTKDNSVNLVFADVPYGMGKNFGNNSDKWDSGASYVDWCKEWIDECMRVLKENGTMYLMTATQHMPFIDVYVSEKYSVLCKIVWAYDSSGV